MVKATRQVKSTQNQLPLGSFEALYQRWQRLRQVLQLPQQAIDPFAPLLPCNHHALLLLLDPPLGEAYRRAFKRPPRR